MVDRLPVRVPLVLLLTVAGLGCSGERESAIPPPADLADQDWTTPAEAAGYRATPSLAETMAYVERLELVAGELSVTTFGRSGLGRELPLVIVSDAGVTSPEAAELDGRPVVLIINGIHPGEIVGKDACLELLRDLLVLRRHGGWLDAMTLLVVPVYNVDGHERADHRHSRINQDGPWDGHGFRTTATGMDLNRDFMKLDTVEARAMVSRLIAGWDPHLVIDVHTTDGLRHRHRLAYAFDDGPRVHPAVAEWTRATIEAARSTMADAGYPIAPYVFPRDRRDLEGQGLAGGWTRPMYSTSYVAQRDRAAFLLEAHSYDSYRDRVAVTRAMLETLLDQVAADPAALLAATAAADDAVADGRATGQMLPLRLERTREAVPFTLLTYRHRVEHSDISGGDVVRWTDEPLDLEVPLYLGTQATLEVPMPAGYLIPPQYPEVAELLRLHGFALRRLESAAEVPVQMVRLEEVEFSDDPYQGRQTARVERWTDEDQVRTFPAGTWWLSLEQAAPKVAAHLLEPAAPDSLFAWGHFARCTEAKEWFSPFVMEPMARQMLDEDADLRAAFERRLADDPAFRGDAGARLEFFYRRSEWADPDYRLYPVARVVDALPDDVVLAEGGGAGG